jgi:transcriptional regulator GlxA family with amidase domain
MASFPAKSTGDGIKRVVFLIYPDIVLLDLVGPLQVFSHAQDPDTGGNGYVCEVVSVAGGTVPTNTIVSIPSAPAAATTTLGLHTLVVVGGDGAIPAMKDDRLLSTVRTLAERARRVSSVCSGALVLAAAGLLDGRRAVTHWDDCKMLAERFPKVQVEMDPIYVRDGSVWTSAGITAGIDMALAMVAEDYGRASALDMARSMVTQMMRSGGQSQFSPLLHRQTLDRTGQFDALHAWVRENLQNPLTVERLAARMAMSPRNFARVYTRTMGITPAKAVEAIRIEAARDALETTNLRIKDVAAKCGFNDEERMRRAFLRLIKVSPSDYRQTFSAV